MESVIERYSKAKEERQLVMSAASEVKVCRILSFGSFRTTLLISLVGIQLQITPID